MQVLENILSQELIQRLGWTLVHFIWQGAIVALVLAILLRLLRKYSANLRYMVSCTALGLIVLLPVATMYLVPVQRPFLSAEFESASAPVIAVEEIARPIPAITETIPTETEVPITDISSSPTVPWRQRVVNVLESGLPYVTCSWLIGVFGLSMWHLGGWTRLQRLKRSMVKPIDNSLQDRLKKLAERLGVNRAVKLLDSALVQAPAVVGWVRPVILLPATALTGLTTEQLEALLAHELAHIKRYDYLVNTLQTVVEILGFYHPAVWWISHTMRLERENCCDDMAVTVYGDNIRYAKALTSMAQIGLGQSGLAVAASGGNLFQRIRRLLSKEPGTSQLNWAGCAIAILLALTLIISTGLAVTFEAKLENNETVDFAGASTKSEQGSLLKVYKVNKKVCDFPEGEDLSTPEAAYATIMRDYMATGASDAEWSKISTWKSKDTKRKTVSPEVAQDYLNARIVEVRIFKERTAWIIAEMEENGTNGYDQRHLFFHKGRWLNSGQGELAPTLKAARETFARKSERFYKSDLESLGESVAARWNRPLVPNPEAYLKPYVDFLKKEGRQPHAFMMKAFKKYELVTMGEVHNRPRYWAFNTELVRDPAFAKSVGTIYIELPSNHQNNIDNFLAQNTCEKEIVIQMLRDLFELGWPCKPTLDFFVAVWEVNQKLPSDKKLRILLVDMQRPWEKIQERKDWQQYSVDRDLFMAQNILKDRETREGKQRHGFFIVGMGHAMEELCYVDQATPRESSGWHLKQALGDQLFTVFQHVPVMTNRGIVSGRLALGLIDTAFAQLDDRPIAFMLRSGPFGSLAFDGMPDDNVYGHFRDGYDAYLYLVPLESEILSPLIEGFYSDDFMPEIDRRYRLMSGRSLFSDIDVPTSERVTKMRAAYWGQPRSWTRKLGPENAWHYGDDWQTKIQKEHLANVRREELTTELDKIYHGIREIDSEKYSLGTWERKFGFNYLTVADWPGMYRWWCDITKEHPLESVEYGELSRNEEGLPQIKVNTVLQGGITFSKVFSFEYDALQDSWQSQYGLDLHLDKKWKDFPKTGKIPSL